MANFHHMSFEEMKEYYKKQMLDCYRSGNNCNKCYSQSEQDWAIPAVTQTEQIAPPPVTPPTTPQPSTLSVEEQYQEFVRNHPAKGFLKAQAFTARRTFPVPGVQVVISKRFGDESYVIATLTTDIAGQTEAVSLHTIDKSLSQSPATHAPYSTYDLRATHPDYMPVNYFNIPIFDGILSTQAIDLIPKAAAPEGITEESYYEREPLDL
jgi:hypothetical protein